MVSSMLLVCRFAPYLVNLRFALQASSRSVRTWTRKCKGAEVWGEFISKGRSLMTVVMAITRRTGMENDD